MCYDGLVDQRADIIIGHVMHRSIAALEAVCIMTCSFQGRNGQKSRKSVLFSLIFHLMLKAVLSVLGLRARRVYLKSTNFEIETTRLKISISINVLKLMSSLQWGHGEHCYSIQLHWKSYLSQHVTDCHKWLYIECITTESFRLATFTIQLFP